MLTVNAHFYRDHMTYSTYHTIIILSQPIHASLLGTLSFITLLIMNADYDIYILRVMQKESDFKEDIDITSFQIISFCIHFGQSSTLIQINTSENIKGTEISHVWSS